MDIVTRVDHRLRAAAYRPSRVEVDSAWGSHLAFGYWLVSETAPRLLVELGTHHGVSYSAFCDAVLDLQLATRCYAVDTWAGDHQAGYYGDEVFADLSRFNAARYPAFSVLVRSTFDDALPHFADGTIDLLHIDGLHTYEAVRHDFEAWLPRLSDRAVVLFHDTNERHDDFGVWRLWDELRAQSPSFEFLHGHGLGVLAVGARAPEAVLALCRQDADAIAETRACFAALGRRWDELRQIAALRGMIDKIDRHAKDAAAYHAEEMAHRQRTADAARAAIEARLAEAQAAQRAEASISRDNLAATIAAVRGLRRERQALRFMLGDLQRERDALLQERGALRDERDRLRHDLSASIAHAARATDRLRAVSASRSWRMTAFLRRGGAEAADDLAAPRAESAPAMPPLTPPDDGDRPPAMDLWRALRLQGLHRLQQAAPPVRIVYVSGEDHTPGHAYRVERYAASAAALGCTVATLGLADVPARMADLVSADIVVVWRAPWSAATERLLRLLRLNGTRFVFDIDDLMFDPALARTEMIDGIRSMGLDEPGTRDLFSRVNALMQHADACTCTTAELAFQIRRFQRPAYVLPNGFDAAAHARSRLALRRRQMAAQDGLVRIGYAGGSRTHQRDFAIAVPALVRILDARPDCRLVLFHSTRDGRPLVDTEEFPELHRRSDRIEWRSLVPLTDLPDELARFDINLAPLEVGNAFCEAKSELKYFEAALVGVCTVASPTAPLRRAMRHTETGMLASTPAEFEAALTALIEDPARRAAMARAAYLDALWQWGPEQRAERLRSFIDQMRGGRDSARSFDLDRLRRTLPPPPLPLRGDCEPVLRIDRLEQARATVVIPLYNYVDYVAEALDSVAAQTEPVLDLVVVDDQSTDGSLAVARDWAERHAARFNRVLILRHSVNAGVGVARNSGFDAAETPWVMLLDADNRLRPECVTALADAAEADGAAFAYPGIETFGSTVRPLPALPYQPMRFAGGNYVDAMALIAKSAWAAAGGFDRMPDTGWEDFDFWCRCAERGLWGVPVDRTLAEYRVHDQSMLHRTTDRAAAKQRLIQRMQSHHPWLAIPPPE